jgi:hypothetical protein
MDDNRVLLYYETQLLDCLADSSSGRTYYIYSGRGLGKTTFLNNFCNRYAKQNENSCIKQFDGKKYSELLKFFIEILDDDKFDDFVSKHQILIIDNLDSFLVECASLEINKSINAVIGIYDILEKISQISSSMSDMGARCLFSGYHRPKSIVDQLYELSNKDYVLVLSSSMFINDYICLPFAPWVLDDFAWESNLESSFHDLEVWNKTDKDDIFCYPENWWKVIYDITGLHPALTGSAIDLIFNIHKHKVVFKGSNAEFISSVFGSNFNDWNEKLENFVYSHLFNDPRLFYCFQRSLERMIESDNNSYLNQGLHLLFELVDSDVHADFSISKKFDNIFVREFLRKEGIVQFDIYNNYIIKGNILTKYILDFKEHYFATAGNFDSYVSIKLKENLDASSGSVVIKYNGNIFTVKLRLSSWSIVKHLVGINNQNRGKIYQIDDIRKSLDGHKSDNSVNSSIRRVRKQFKDSGLPPDLIIKNIRGEGYVCPESKDGVVSKI